jgi:hypothetical protein
VSEARQLTFDDQLRALIAEVVREEIARVAASPQPEHITVAEYANDDRLTLSDFSEVEPGDYGWCVLDSATPQLVFYDNEEWCCDRKDEKAHECDDQCGGDSYAVIYESDNLSGRVTEVPFGSLLAVPLQINTTSKPSGLGWIYAIALVPDIDIRRIKVGFTERPVAARLAQYRTANPTALLIGLWEGARYAEQRSHSVLDGRIGHSEVFQVSNLARALDGIDAEIRRPRP